MRPRWARGGELPRAGFAGVGGCQPRRRAPSALGGEADEEVPHSKPASTLLVQCHCSRRRSAASTADRVGVRVRSAGRVRGGKIPEVEHVDADGSLRVLCENACCPDGHDKAAWQSASVGASRLTVSVIWPFRGWATSDSDTGKLVVRLFAEAGQFPLLLWHMHLAVNVVSVTTHRSALPTPLIL